MHSQLCLLILFIDGIRYVIANFYVAFYMNRIKNRKFELLNPYS